GHPADRTRGGEGGGCGSGRRGGGDRAGLLRRGARRLDRRWVAAVGRVGVEVAGPAEPDRGQLGPRGGAGREFARRAEATSAVAAARVGRDRRLVPGGAGGLHGGPARGPAPPE